MNDDELMAGVRETYQVLDPVPAAVLAAARASIAWRAPAARLAELEHDRGGRAAGVRGGPARTLTFTCPGVTVEIEVTPDGRLRRSTGGSSRPRRRSSRSGTATCRRAGSPRARSPRECSGCRASRPGW